MSRFERADVLRGVVAVVAVVGVVLDGVLERPEAPVDLEVVVGPTRLFTRSSMSLDDVLDAGFWMGLE